MILAYPLKFGSACYLRRAVSKSVELFSPLASTTVLAYHLLPQVYSHSFPAAWVLSSGVHRPCPCGLCHTVLAGQPHRKCTQSIDSFFPFKFVFIMFPSWEGESAWVYSWGKREEDRHSDRVFVILQSSSSSPQASQDLSTWLGIQTHGWPCGFQHCRSVSYQLHWLDWES